MPFQKLSNLGNKIPIRYVGATLIAIPAICLTTAMGVWVVSQRINRDLYHKVERTNERLVEVKKLLTGLLDAESSVRGFTITRDSEYLELYQKTISNLPAIAQQIEKESWQTPEAGTIVEIKNLYQKRLQLLEARVNLSKSDRSVPNLTAKTRQTVIEGTETMNQMRYLINKFERQESQKLQKYKQNLARSQEIGNLIIWVTSSISLLVYLKLIYLFSTLDWRLAGQELEISEINSFLKTVMDNVVDGVIALNQNNEIDTFNQAASEMFVISASEAIGQKVDKFITVEPTDKGSHQEALLDFSDAHFIALGHRAIGSNFPLEISVSRVLSGHKKMLIIRDITERKEAQKKLESHVRELSRLSLMLSQVNQNLSDRNQELDKFAYVASHDLKAPLRAIFSLSEWIEEDLGDKLAPENQYQMQLLRQRVSRMEALINGLLEYCRVGRTESKTEVVDTEILVREIIDSLGIPSSFKIEIASNLPKLQTKSLLLRQVLANLISNAVKHQIQPQGTIEISCQELDKFYEFRVKDDGVGIAPEYQEQIFQMFQTLEARDTKENTGIGLAIVKKIVELEGGKIWVNSDVGKGATFCFTWRKQPRE